MKRIKQFTSRMLAVMLAGTVAIGSVSVTAFGAEDVGSTVAAAEEFSVEEGTEEGVVEPSSAETVDEEMMTESSSAEVVDGQGVSESPDAAFADTSEMAAEEAAVTSYTVTLDANGGYFANEWDDVLNETLEKTEVLNKIVPVGGMVSVVPVKEQEGNVATFLGWSLERDGEILPQDQEGYAPVGDCVLYAVWKYDDAADPSVAIGEDVPEEVVNNPIETEEPDASAPEEEITQEKNDSEDVLIDETAAEETADEEPATYAVTLDANGGYFVNEWDDVLGEYVEHAETLNKVIPVGGVVSIVPVNEQDGITATFLGWSLERDGEILPQEQEGYAPVGDCVLYAIWEVIESENAINNDEIDEDYEAEPAEEASFQDNKEEKEENIETIDEEAFAAVHETKGLGEYQNSEKTVSKESNKTSLPKEKEGSSNGDTAEIAVEDDSNEEFVSEEAMGAATYAQREYNGHMYQLFNEGVSWSTAKKRCEEKGGHLVTVTSSGEYSFCKSLLGDLSPKYCWMGATYTSGTWKWITGETWGFTAWSPNQPNGSGGGTYALMQNFKGVGSAWNWDDQGNSGTSPSEKYKGSPYYHLTKNYCYICEWDISIDIIAHHVSGIIDGHSFLRLNNGLPKDVNLGNYKIEAGKSVYIGFRGDRDLGYFENVVGAVDDDAGCFINYESSQEAYSTNGVYNSYCIDTIFIGEHQLSTLLYYMTDCGYYAFIKNNCTTFAINVWNKFADSKKQIPIASIASPLALKKELRDRGSKVYTKLPTYGADGTDTYKVTWRGEFIQYLTGETDSNCVYNADTNSITVTWSQIKKKINDKEYNLDGYVVFCIDSEGNERYIINDDISLSCTFGDIKPNEEYKIAITSKKEYSNPAMYDDEDKSLRSTILYSLYNNYLNYKRDLERISKGFLFKDEEIILNHLAVLNTTNVKTFNTKNIKDAIITGLHTETYTGKAITQRPIVKIGSIRLIPNTDYTISYKNNINAGTAKVTIIGKGRFTGTKIATFKISKASLAKATVSCPASKVWAGWTLTPVPTVKVGSKTLKKGTDFSLTFTNTKNVGLGTITITGKGNYAGTIKKNFKINPKPTSISKLSGGSRNYTIGWKKQPSQTSGYQIQYSSRSDFKTQKIVTVSGASKTSRTVSGLAKKHKYYVRIRTYKTVGKTKYYSTWSAAKTVTTK